MSRVELISRMVGCCGVSDRRVKRFELGGEEIDQVRVQTLSVVEDLDGLEQRAPRRGPRREHRPVYELLIERAPVALGNRVVQQSHLRLMLQTIPCASGRRHSPLANRQQAQSE